MRRITTTFVLLGMLLAIAGTTRAGQEEQFTPEFKEARTSYDPKHTPKMSAPDSVKRGQWFDVTGAVGAHVYLAARGTERLLPDLQHVLAGRDVGQHELAGLVAECVERMVRDDDPRS